MSDQVSLSHKEGQNDSFACVFVMLLNLKTGRQDFKVSGSKHFSIFICSEFQRVNAVCFYYKR